VQDCDISSGTSRLRDCCDGFGRNARAHYLRFGPKVDPQAGSGIVAVISGRRCFRKFATLADGRAWNAACLF